MPKGQRWGLVAMQHNKRALQPAGHDRATSMSTGETGVPAGQSQTTAPALADKVLEKTPGRVGFDHDISTTPRLQLVRSQPPGDEQEEGWFLGSCAQQESRLAVGILLPCCSGEIPGWAARGISVGPGRAGSRGCRACQDADRKSGSGLEHHEGLSRSASAWSKERCRRLTDAYPGNAVRIEGCEAIEPMCDGLVQAKIEGNQSCGERRAGGVEWRQHRCRLDSLLYALGCRITWSLVGMRDVLWAVWKGRQGEHKAQGCPREGFRKFGWHGDIAVRLDSPRLKAVPRTGLVMDARQWIIDRRHGISSRRQRWVLRRGRVPETDRSNPRDVDGRRRD